MPDGKNRHNKKKTNGDNKNSKMLTTTHSGALIEFEAEAITVEVNSGQRGELKYILVGLPDSAVEESQDRVLSALDNCGF